MKLSELKHAKGARRNSKRVGRGQGSGHGRTSGRGHKGQKARAGASIPAWFEGGQMPLSRRIPIKGFKNPSRVEYEVVNLRDLERSGLEGEVTVEVLRASGVVRRGGRPVKVLAIGDISRPLTLRVHAVSGKALDKIKAVGGTVELIK